MKDVRCSDLEMIDSICTPIHRALRLHRWAVIVVNDGTEFSIIQVSALTCSAGLEEDVLMNCTHLISFREMASEVPVLS